MPGDAVTFWWGCDPLFSFGTLALDVVDLWFDIREV